MKGSRGLKNIFLDNKTKQQMDFVQFAAQIWPFTPAFPKLQKQHPGFSPAIEHCCIFYL